MLAMTTRQPHKWHNLLSFFPLAQSSQPLVGFKRSASFLRLPLPLRLSLPRRMSAFRRSVPSSESGGGMGVLEAGGLFLTPDVDGVASSLIFGVFVPREAFLINCLNMVSNGPFTKSPSSPSSSSPTSALLLDKGPICLIHLVKRPLTS